MECNVVKKTKKLEQRSNNFFVRTITLAYYKRIVKKEIKLGNIKETDNVLCMGGGYFPCTAILISKLTNANVTVIDNDIDTINSAKEKVEFYKLSDKIKVVFSEGKEMNAMDYDVVCVANQISPKDEVIRQIKETIKNGRILVRIPKDCISHCYNKCEYYEGISIKQPFYSNIGRTYICHVNESYI